MKKIALLFPLFVVPLLANCGARTYVVLWKNYDGEILERDDNVPDGTVPTFESAEPTHPSDEMHAYQFSGWDPEVVPAHSDQIYTAVYSQINNFTEINVEIPSDNYTATFKNILPVDNSLKVSWGDGFTTVSETDTISHTYEVAGTYNVELLNFTSIVPCNTETKNIFMK